MRESIGSTYLFMMVFVFILLFSGYLAVTISYSITFKVKNEVTSIIERKKGVYLGGEPKTIPSVLNTHTSVYNGAGSLEIISMYLYGSGYKTKGTCPNYDTAHWWGVTDLGVKKGTIRVSPVFEHAKSGGKYSYCFKMNNDDGTKIYYDLKLFYKIDLPVIGDLYTFSVDGVTDDINVSTAEFERAKYFN